MQKIEDPPEEKKLESQAIKDKSTEAISHTEEKHEFSHEDHSHQGHSHERHSYESPSNLSHSYKSSSHEKNSQEGHSHDHDCPHTHDEGVKSNEEGEEEADNKQSRSEKKCRKAIQECGLEPVPSIKRVTMIGSNYKRFVIENPEIMKSPNSDFYVVFGVSKSEDLGNIQANAGIIDWGILWPEEEKDPVDLIKEDLEGEEEGDLDDTGLRTEDIKAIMYYCKVSKRKAIKALREANGDAVDAILKLS